VDRGPGDACALIGNANRRVAVFPAEGLLTYEVSGLLADLVGFFRKVYDHYRQSGGPFKDALRKVETEPEQNLVGRSLARA
jgi:hypothetical protein